MTTDIAKSLFRTIAQEGFVFGSDHFRTLQVHYVRLAQDLIRRYYADAVLNGLSFDRHGEDQAVHVFARSIQEAAASFMEDPLGSPQIPNWNRVAAAIPDIYDRLKAAVETPFTTSAQSRSAARRAKRAGR
jgi:glucosyl-3-phosphoglycerate synthase